MIRAPDLVDHALLVHRVDAATGTYCSIDGATLAALEERGDGHKTLRVLIPFNRFFRVAESTRPGKAERPSALILWFDDAMRVRSIMPATEEKFRAQTLQQGYRLIDLEGGK